MSICTRFAPSPTGYLHIGGARTALFSWLYARHHGGEFVLRIEDTDLERNTVESVNAILEGMVWLGLTYDRGPFYQTEHFARYREVIQKLLDTGHAYHCYCTREELEAMRTEQMERKEKPRYDGRCRHRKEPREGVQPVVRFRTPEEGVTIVDDMVRGKVAFQNHELDDLIIARSDGTPTYNLTVVVDDMDMKITHVIRGDDHLNNTPRQINILRALGAEPPRYGHLPMILGPDGLKLSKRHGAVSVMQYRDEGYLPEAVLNYLVRLGWSHGDQEIFTLDELVRLFDIAEVNQSASAINPEKLLWLNQHYIRTLDPDHVARELGWHLGQIGIDPSEGPEPRQVVLAQRDRCRTLREMAEASVFFYREFTEYDPKAWRKNLTAEALPVLQALHDGFRALGAWEKEALHQVVLHTGEMLGLKLGKVAQPLRVALTGGTASPSIDLTLELVGRDRTIARIERAQAKISAESA
ncbi:glutamate--tRNA ligase [Thioalkalivibrio paradoxus]|uniref:Glutamate--tRNA ligase n=1 Tax=Thioalkalivibrio paradoxus ARh 1 TaxID=713585 RepID=W0DME7_9GAMM|nr:glutamate--tRNA ligase [Thioalkalivibrio paradoxus]AHE98153.1 glutaminyl-tRNA synthetase [Thioalkalivibrio paradoxus ARh 1]